MYIYYLVMLYMIYSKNPKVSKYSLLHLFLCIFYECAPWAGLCAMGTRTWPFSSPPRNKAGTWGSGHTGPDKEGSRHWDIRIHDFWPRPWVFFQLPLILLLVLVSLHRWGDVFFKVNFCFWSSWIVLCSVSDNMTSESFEQTDHHLLSATMQVTFDIAIISKVKCSHL